MKEPARSLDSVDHVLLRSGAYADSVTLLQVSRTVQQTPGVVTAQVAMATPLNVEVLTGMGFAIPAEATANDLVIALRLESDDGLDAALAAVDAALSARRTSSEGAARAPHRTTGAALREQPGVVLLALRPGTLPRSDPHLRLAVRHRVVGRPLLSARLLTGLWAGLLHAPIVGGPVRLAWCRTC